jgi:hypothetical protein
MTRILQLRSCRALRELKGQQPLTDIEYQRLAQLAEDCPLAGEHFDEVSWLYPLRIPLDTKVRILDAETGIISALVILNRNQFVGLIGDHEFKKMEKKPIVINTSRGPIIDEKALIKALAEGQISGAGLDVLEKEPPDPENPLLKMNNVILSPHVSFYSVESISELKRRTAKNVSDVLRGRWPISVVNREVIGKTRASIQPSLDQR